MGQDSGASAIIVPCVQDGFFEADDTAPGEGCSSENATPPAQTPIFQAFAEACLVACAESTGIGRVASFDRSIDRINTIERIEPPKV
ncbi:MAG TPA: hypothetical protein VLZ05_10750 [Mycobacterium sp.]|nr:hypothetical protein [Mycobacterium sp.]